MRLFAHTHLYVVICFLVGCASNDSIGLLDNNAYSETKEHSFAYVIGAGDELTVFVWGNPELSVSVPVKPDGRITTPLVEDVVASGKTSTQLARDVEKRLQQYVKSPVVTVTVTNFVGRYSEQIRVIGAATKPVALPYRHNMTLLDVLIAVGGMSEFASGNRSSIVRESETGVENIRVRLDDMLSDGDMSQNMLMQPGDILVIPESLF